MSAESSSVLRLLETARSHIRDGRLQEAWNALTRARELAPADPEPLRRMIGVAVRLGDLEAARSCVEALISLLPTDAGAYVRLGIVCVLQGRLRDAEAAYRAALDLDGNMAEALSGLGRIALAQGQADGARAFFERALKADPRHPDATAGLALLFENTGDPRRAVELLAPLASSGSANAEVARILAGAARQLGDPGPALNLVTALLQRSPAPAERAELLFSLAGLQDFAGRHDEAFRAAAEANRLIGGRFDTDAFLRRIDRAVHSRWHSAVADHDHADTPMVFVVGVPRSGTTLVEQILAQHPAVLAVGEHSRIEDMALRLEQSTGQSWEEAVGACTASQLAAMADRYLAPLGRIPPEIRVVTDKMPVNFLYLGLIARVFPAARVIWCRRNPLDVGISCYLQAFGGRGVEFANDLAHIGLYIRESHRLMAHWRQVLELPIHELGYENLVADPAGEVSRLLDALGLGWEDRCLRFHESRRFVGTPSYAQVRRPVHGGAVGRHEHYRGYLGSLEEALRGSGDADRPPPGSVTI